MNRVYFQISILLAFLGVSTPLHCCIWDGDTTKMERKRFPDAHELIAGYFVRHSEEYYKWRIQDRNKKGDRKTHTDYDDIAVAYDKLGQQDKAIAFIKEKLEKWPDQGTYESHANLGTFLIHNGQFKEGLVHIEKAIEINPDAHFGREIYQKLLVEYLLECGFPENGLPLSQDEGRSKIPQGFAAYIFDDFSTEELNSKDVKMAIKGVLGMMRFGNHNSPILLEALGDLLLCDGFSKDAALLATRAYLMASYSTEDPEVSEKYREKARSSISQQLNWTTEILEGHLEAELKQGNDLFEDIKSKEAMWIANKQNLDKEFYKTYSSIPKLKLNYWNPNEISTEAKIFKLAIYSFPVICIVLAIYLSFKKRRKLLLG